MSFGLEEDEVKQIVDSRVQLKYGNTLAMVQKNRDMIDDSKKQSGWDRALGSGLRRLDKELEALKSRIDMLEARINNPPNQ